MNEQAISLATRPMFKVRDHELLNEIIRRGDDQKTLDALTKLRRMFALTAEQREHLAPGLKVAIALADTFAMQYGEMPKNPDALKGLLRPETTSPRPATAAGPVSSRAAISGGLVGAVRPFKSKRGRSLNGVNVSAQMREYVMSWSSTAITAGDLHRAFPAAGSALAYMVLGSLVQRGMLVKEGKIYRKVSPCG